jgi:hypothetical protein
MDYNGPHARDGRANSGPSYAIFGNGCIDHSSLTESFEQPFSSIAYVPWAFDTLANNENRWVCVHHLVERLIYGEAIL